MAARKPISLVKGDSGPGITWPGEGPRFQESDVDEVLSWAVGQGASDITIQTDRPIYNDIHGKLYPGTFRPLDAADMAIFLSHIYGDDAQARLASGRDLDLSYEIKRDRYTRIRFRVNITPILAKGRDAAQITMRVLPTEPPLLSDLEIEDDIIENWHPRQGIVLVTGPTGSGKSTLLAAGTRMLLEQDGGCGKVLTYEAPIEFTYDTIHSPNSLVSQTEIPRHIEDFAHGVRNALRRKPEIIVVGEARDRETISAAIEAGQTGHTVYSTTHTTGVASTIRRMITTFEPEERGERAYALMETLRMVVTQVLAPKLGGGRIGLREWMVFDDAVREKLLDMDFNNWSPEIERMIERYGQKMNKSADIAFKDKKIDKNTYLMITQGGS